MKAAGPFGGWYACVESIRALRTQIKPLQPAHAGERAQRSASALIKESKAVALQLSWFYSAQDLRDQAGPASSAWKGPSAAMGPNERVKTDTSDWNWESKTVSRSGPETMYVFDDSFPAPHPECSGPSAHPLWTYSTSVLLALAASPYAYPALRTPSRKRGAGDPEQGPGVPDYFFGVGAESPWEGKVEEKLPREGDGVRQVPYVRVGFSFTAQEPHSDEGEDCGEKEEERMSPRKAGKRKRVAKRVWPLTFVPHSTSKTPYNPPVVQHYSRAAKKWYNVTDLFGRRALPARRRAPCGVVSRKRGCERGAELAGGEHHVDAHGYEGARGAQGATADFSIELPVSRTPSRASTAAPSADPLPALDALARAKIVRGGAYGLTGNAYLSTRAGELAAALRSSTTAGSTELGRDAARALLRSAGDWEAEVARRERGAGGARGLGREWRADGREVLERLSVELPLGQNGSAAGRWEWVCPESGEVI